MFGGQWWRLLSGHLVHLGWSHLMLNLGGLALAWLLVGRLFSASFWVLLLLICALSTSLGLLFFNPLLDWYVGLSGVLHGLLLAGGVVSALRGEREAWLLCALVAGKLLWEQLLGPLPGSSDAAGGTVIVDAHLYGGVSGLVAGLLAVAMARPMRERLLSRAKAGSKRAKP